MPVSPAQCDKFSPSTRWTFVPCSWTSGFISLLIAFWSQFFLRNGGTLLLRSSTLGLGQEVKHLCWLWSTKWLWKGVQRTVIHLVCKIVSLADGGVRDKQLLVAGLPYARWHKNFYRCTEVCKCTELEELGINSTSESAWLTTRHGGKEWVVVGSLGEGIVWTAAAVTVLLPHVVQENWDRGCGGSERGVSAQ